MRRDVDAARDAVAAAVVTWSGGAGRDLYVGVA